MIQIIVQFSGKFFFFNKITVNESLKILEISVCDFIDQMIMKIKDN